MARGGGNVGEMGSRTARARRSAKSGFGGKGTARPLHLAVHTTLALLLVLMNIVTVLPARVARAADCVGPVGLPFTLDFNGATGDGCIADKAGKSIGFNSVQSSSNGGGYLPTNLDLDTSSGKLIVTTTKGIQFKTASTTTNGNSLDNGLQVPVAAAGKTLRIETTIVTPPNGSNNSEQAGIWFGTNEDNYAKVVIASAGTSGSTYKFQLLREMDGVSTGASGTAPDEIDSGNSSLSGKAVTLILIADATNGKVTGSYSIDGGAEQALGSLTVPAAFFSGSFAGIMATHRNRAANANPVALQYGFDRFAIAAITPPDTTAPAAPTGLTATAGDGQIVLDWTDNAEADLAGYKVYRSDTPTVAVTGTPLSTPTTSAFTDGGRTNGATYYYAVVAVDQMGNVSAASATKSATPDTGNPPAFTLPVQINFQDEATTPPSGYTKDFGQAYANVRGFGWVEPGTSAPRSLVTNGRNRAESGLDPRLNTLMHMQGNTVANFNGVAQPGSWEIALPNGTYRVEVSVGDANPGNDATTHRINVEGINAIDNFVVTAATVGAARFKSGTITVTVSDGRLTIDADGGTNTKINYVIISAAAPTDTTPPTVAAVLPADGASGVAAAANVAATFSEAMDPATLTTATVTLAGPGGAAVAAAAAYDAASKTVTLDPSADLVAGAAYTATVKGGAGGAAGRGGQPARRRQDLVLHRRRARGRHHPACGPLWPPGDRNTGEDRPDLGREYRARSGGLQRLSRHERERPVHQAERHAADRDLLRRYDRPRRCGGLLSGEGDRQRLPGERIWSGDRQRHAAHPAG